MHARKGPTTPIVKSQQLQRKLFLAAKRCPERRFHALYDRIYRPDILWRAWKEVRSNARKKDEGPGVDGLTVADIERAGVEELLERIASDLRSKTYRPRPVKRVYIDKADGSKRALGIPTVRDRIVQQACKIVIEPIFEVRFRDCSYGFRPRRSPQQAAKEVKRNLVCNWWVVDADIRNFFDVIDHSLLERLLKRCISDRRVLKLIRQWLKAGVLEQGEWIPTDGGSPQGGVISPLLANIYLHVLDMFWTRRFSHLGKLVRYADDVVIICQSEGKARRALLELERIMATLKLTLHPGKTRVVDLFRAGFDFVGFHFHKMRSRRSGKLVPYMWPGRRAMKSIRKKIRLITTRKRSNQTVGEIAHFLNRKIRGWRNYFRAGNSTKKLQDLDRYVRLRMQHWFRTRKGSRGAFNEKVYDLWVGQTGIEYFYQTCVCVS